MIKRKGIWHYDFVVGGKRYRGTTGYSDKKQAQAVEERLKVQYREGHSAEVVWEQTKKQLLVGNDLPIDAVKIWSAFSTQSVSRANAKRQKVYFSRLTEFCNWMKEKYPDTKKISEVTSLQAKEWWAHIRSFENSNATKNDKLVALKMIFASMGKDYGVIEDPFSSIKKLPQNSMGREAFTPEELKLIGQKASGWIYSLCVTAISTGLREGDICNLKKSSVNLKTGWISIPHTRKTGVAVDIPILPGLRQHLQEVMEESDSEYVFPVLEQKYRNDQCSISKGIKAFFAEIGISDAVKKVDGYAKKLSSKDAHSFRHTFIYLAAVNGIPLPIVQGIVGHVTPEMTKYYMNHAGRAEKSQYLAQLPEYFFSSPGPEVVLPYENKRMYLKGDTPREELAELAYSLPIEKVKYLLSMIKKLPPKDGGSE